MLSLHGKAPGVTVTQCREPHDARGWLALSPGTLQSCFQPCKMLTHSISTVFINVLNAERDYPA